MGMIYYCPICKRYAIATYEISRFMKYRSESFVYKDCSICGSKIVSQYDLLIEGDYFLEQLGVCDYIRRVFLTGCHDESDLYIRCVEKYGKVFYLKYKSEIKDFVHKFVSGTLNKYKAFIVENENELVRSF